MHSVLQQQSAQLAHKFNLSIVPDIYMDYVISIQRLKAPRTFWPQGQKSDLDLGTFRLRLEHLRRLTSLTLPQNGGRRHLVFSNMAYFKFLILENIGNCQYICIHNFDFISKYIVMQRRHFNENSS